MGRTFIHYGDFERGCDQFGYQIIDGYFPEGCYPTIHTVRTKEEILEAEPNAKFEENR
jgi:hypothetical protein